MDQEKRFQDALNKQFLLRSKATIAYHQSQYETMYAYALEAIKLTKPDFNEDAIDSYILFYDEIMIINQIAIYYKLFDTAKSLDILLKLKASIDKVYTDEEEKAKTYIKILYNITNCMGVLKKYEEAIDLCNQGIQLCIRHEHSYHYSRFLYNKACALLFLGNNIEGKALLDDAAAIFKAYGNLEELHKIEDYVKENYNIIL